MKAKLLVSVLFAVIFAAFVSSVRAQGISMYGALAGAEKARKKMVAEGSLDKASEAKESCSVAIVLDPPYGLGSSPRQIFVLNDEVNYVYTPRWGPRDVKVTLIADGDGNLRRISIFQASTLSSLLMTREKNGVWRTEGKSGGQLFGLDAEKWEARFKESPPVRIVHAPLW